MLGCEHPGGFCPGGVLSYILDCQFYFKSGYSTDICIYTLKEIIHFYKSHSSPVFVCYMDATKAFDKINHWTLFNKLIDRGVPLIIVRMLYYWYL